MMKILDKNTDFYDYLQNVYSDPSTTFDRTDSFLVTKEIMCQHLYITKRYSFRNRYNSRQQYNFLLLQVGHTFWLFLVEITKIDEYENPTDYTIELITSWKNYKKHRVQIQLDVIQFDYVISEHFYAKNYYGEYSKEKLMQKKVILQQATDNGQYKVKNKINRYTVYNGDRTKTEKHIPLLKACGISQYIEPLDIFLALEEYFSLEKTSQERTEPLGTTDVDKIESHGFDSKTSFRNVNH